MSKTKKKRNKKYTGVDSSSTKPSVTKVSVPNRSKFGRWWVEHKSKVTRNLAIVGIVLLLYGIVSWLIGVIF